MTDYQPNDNADFQLHQANMFLLQGSHIYYSFYGLSLLYVKLIVNYKHILYLEYYTSGLIMFVRMIYNTILKLPFTSGHIMQI